MCYMLSHQNKSKKTLEENNCDIYKGEEYIFIYYYSEKYILEYIFKNSYKSIRKDIQYNTKDGKIQWESEE